MKSYLFTIVNSIGCLVLLVIVCLQWRQSEEQRDAHRAILVKEHAAKEARDEAVARANALMTDITELKSSYMETQKAADAAGLTLMQKSEELAVAKSANEQAAAERDIMQKRMLEWEAAIKLRDQTITEQNAAMIALRKKLDEAIAQLKKAGAR
ncbi:MAG: hypothetical protein V4727_03070 [Verrucomicrobiota bacterium]